MLLYNHAFDLYHCMYRMLLIIEAANAEKLTIIRARLLDFIGLFPPKTMKIDNRYKVTSKYWGAFNDDMRDRVFNQIEPYHLAALKGLVSYNLINSQEFLNGQIVRTAEPIPASISKNLKKPDGYYIVVSSALKEFNSKKDKFIFEYLKMKNLI